MYTTPRHGVSNRTLRTKEVQKLNKWRPRNNPTTTNTKHEQRTTKLYLHSPLTPTQNLQLINKRRRLLHPKYPQL